VNGFLQISEQVFIPIHRIERVSFFGASATIKYIDDRQVDTIVGEDADRLRRQMMAVL
jgi:hypothetical protein